MLSTPTITLNRVEQRVCKLLVDAAAEIDSTRVNDNEEPLTLRITGGWVRDKLLGGECNDIDVGINKMTGFEFATRLSKFLQDNMNRYKIPAKNIHKIESNPEKSKHLETATTRILGLDIDFVNLRSEAYTSESRIPQMEFGTPTQDALRRDACINALFFNLHTHEIEDFTKRGFQDMKERLIRTPLPPFETFNDDPLRVLRLIRFASRLEFDIVVDAKKAMKDPRIKKALRQKISRERTGAEIEKMLKGPHPFRALSYINELDLYESIFAPTDESLNLPNLPKDDMIVSATILLNLSAPAKFVGFRELLSNDLDSYVGWVLAALAPWKGHQFPGVDTKKNIPAAATAARDGLCAPIKLYDTIIRAYRNYGYIQDFARESLETPNASDMSRSKVGVFIRQLGADWKSQFLCALLLETIPVWTRNVVNTESKKVWEKYHVLLANIKELGLMHAHSIRPILDGRKMLEKLDQKKSGPFMKKAMDSLVVWQLDNPECDEEAAGDWVVKNKKDLLAQ
ncbi:hypothetical protein EDC01DRAFT_719055 [Geopyxis carbonaria]|nr:hypothetical protein EDC01DRAFT_719055 [Geopyxis carbonaria]